VVVDLVVVVDLTATATGGADRSDISGRAPASRDPMQSADLLTAETWTATRSTLAAQRFTTFVGKPSRDAITL
jgi:hypothetical protein